MARSSGRAMSHRAPLKSYDFAARPNADRLLIAFCVRSSAATRRQAMSISSANHASKSMRAGDSMPGACIAGHCQKSNGGQAKSAIYVYNGHLLRESRLSRLKARSPFIMRRGHLLPVPRENCMLFLGSCRRGGKARRINAWPARRHLCPSVTLLGADKRRQMNALTWPEGRPHNRRIRGIVAVCNDGFSAQK